MSDVDLRLAGGADPRRHRRGYLDWMRGLAVLIMIEAHLLDSWTRVPDRESREFVWAVILGGFGAPLFLFLAGVSVVLSAGSKSRRGHGTAVASAAVVRRGLEIFGLAFLFRLQSVILSGAAWRSILKVDILNIMGPSIAAAAALWGAVRTTRARYAVFAAAAIGIALATPVVREVNALAWVPDPIEAYLRPVQPFSSFVLFPWAGLVFAGAVLGVALDGVASRDREARLNAWLFAGGLATALAGFGASYMPSPYERSEFWTSSPSYFFTRVGLMTAAVALAFAWESRPRWRSAWSPMQQLGRTSLFVYWIHVELIYGLISQPLHKALTLWQAFAAFLCFSALMLACSIVKDRLAAWWHASRRLVVSPSCPDVSEG